MSYAALNTEAIHPGVRPHTGPGLGFTPSPWRYDLAGVGYITHMAGFGAEPERHEFLGAERRGFLGAVSADERTSALAAGLDSHTLDTLDALGATDGDIEELLAGAIDLPALMQQLTGGPPSAGVPAGQMNAEPTDWLTYGVESALDSLDADVGTLESLASSDPRVNAAVGSQVAAERAQVNSWRGTYQGWVNAAPQPQVFTMPDGSKLIGTIDEAGVNPVAIVAVAAVLALAGAIVYYHTQTVNATMAEALAAQSTAQTAGMSITSATQFFQRADAADAAGDHVSAAQFRAQGNAILKAGTPVSASGMPTDWGAWLQKNAVVIGLIGAAVILGPSLIKRIGK
jgi:hypothetical protein